MALVWPGFSIAPLTDEIRRELGLNRSSGHLIISSIDEASPAAVAGLKRGDVVRSVNGRKVDTLLDFYRSFNSGPKEIQFILQRQETELSIGLVR